VQQGALYYKKVLSQWTCISVIVANR